MIAYGVLCEPNSRVGGVLSDEYVSSETTRNAPAGRTAGIVLHPTSLDGPYGCGDLGDATHAFVDWLASAGMKAWQVLPLVPPDEDYFSPYSGQDALCGNPVLICLEYLVQEGLLDEGASPLLLFRFQLEDVTII
jgi:4-alpha-glucanotransferase